MRVLVLTADYPPLAWSGIGVAVQRQARALAALGVQVTVLVSGPPGRERPRGEDEPAGVEVRSLACPRFPVDPGACDWVHLHSLPLAGLAAELCRRFGLKLACTVHALVHLEQPGPGWSRQAAFWSAVQRRVLRLCRRAIFLGEGERDAALALWPDLQEKAVVIPNGLPEERPPPPPAAGGPLVFAGRFAESKGLPLLADAMDRVFAEEPRARLVLAGGHGDAAGERAVARMRRTHPERCEVRGWLSREELRGLLASASIALVPSRYEPFGQVALEAMALGTPVLASAVGGLRQIAGPLSGGRLVERHEPAAWARATLELLGDPAERERLRRRGPAHVAAHFEIGAVARKLLSEAYAA